MSHSHRFRIYSEDRPSDGLSPRMTLCEFFREWFLPIVLEGGGRRPGTVVSYRETLKHWSTLSGDPPLEEITDHTLAQFKAALRAATWQRSALGQRRLMSSYTFAKHVRQLRAVLFRAGQGDPKRPGKSLLGTMPYLTVPQPQRCSPKPPFTLQQARAIYAAALEVPLHSGDVWTVPPADFFTGLLSVLYYTGLRIGTVLALTPKMVEQREGGTWLRIPGSITKTGNGVSKFLHPHAASRLKLLKPHDGRLFHWPHHLRYLTNRHDALQKAAGLSIDQRQTPHVWRRTHATELAKLGASFGTTLARMSLDHADSRTTSEFYVSLEATIIAQLPRLDRASD